VWKEYKDKSEEGDKEKETSEDDRKRKIS